MSLNFDNASTADQILGSITRPGAISPNARVLETGDHADALALAQVHATLAVADALQDIAETLKGIRTFGTAQTR